MANSYPLTVGPPVLFWEGNGPYKSFGGAVDVDTSGIVQIRGQNVIQRAGTDIVDVTGKVYNDTGLPVTLVKIQFSAVGLSGPWTDGVILPGDPAYSFPAVGTPAGESFNVPLQITAYIQDYLYYNIEMSY